MAKEQDEILTVADLTRILHINKQTAYALVREGQFPVLKVGKLYRIPRKPFEEWIRNAS